MQSLFQRSLKNPRLWQIALACYWVALFIGTHVPIQRLALNRGVADKFAHLAAFGGLAMLLAITWRVFSGPLQRSQLVSVWILVVLYGAIEETTQPLAYRTASLIDWLADAIGATLGLAVFWWLSGWLDKLIPVPEFARDEARPSTWRRFSLRTLFVAMTLAAVTCYWMMLPTMNAQRFVRALYQRQYPTAEGLFISQADKFPGNLKKFAVFETDPRLQPLTWGELWKGERRIIVETSYGKTKGEVVTCGATISAYRHGLVLHPLVLFLAKPPSKS